MLQDAVRCFEEAGTPGQIGRAYVSLGRVYRAHGRLAEALEQYARAVAMQQGGDDRLAAVQSLNAIGVTLGYMGRYGEGLERLQEALGIARRMRSQRTVRFPAREHRHVPPRSGPLRRSGGGARGEHWPPPALPYEVSAPRRAVAGVSRVEAARRRRSRWPSAPWRRRAARASRSRRWPPAPRRCIAARSSSSGRRTISAAPLRRSRRCAPTPSPTIFSNAGSASATRDLFLQHRAARGSRAIARSDRDRRTRAGARVSRSPGEPRAGPRRRRSAPAGSSPATFERHRRDRGAPCVRRSSPIGCRHRRRSSGSSAPTAPSASARIPVTATALASMVRDATGSAIGIAGADGGDDARRRERGRPWRALYRLLVEPIRRYLPAASGSRLTIVPHGPLFGLPFAALRDASGRYLVESYELHYVPAIGALQAPRRASRRQRPSALLVGDPGPDAARDGLMPLPALPWADREVAAIEPAAARARRRFCAARTRPKPTFAGSSRAARCSTSPPTASSRTRSS